MAHAGEDVTSHAGMTDDEILADMRRTNTLFDEEGRPELNMNDTFCYACGEAEPVPSEAMAAVIDIYRRFGWVGCVCWAAKRRGEDPVVEYTESPVYQAIWTALYGETRLKPNRCNQADPRWSDERLELPRWE
jgi:hypothetical protein